MKWILVALLTTAAAMAAGQNATLPEGEGKSVINSACTSCHGVDLITAKTGTRDEWAAIVERMKTYGTNLSTAQTTTVVDYLAKSFGPKGATPAAAAQTDADAAGKALVDGVCASCHAADLTTSKQATRAEWAQVVETMKGYGASLDEKQTATLLDYLEKHHGLKSAAASEVDGKKLLEGFCANCHDLDIVSARTGTQAEWQEVVERMNGRGAGVPDKDIPLMVQYLVKTYPSK
jgi:cytochrome c5